MFDHGRYDARKVLYIAFLHCKHVKRAIQERSLWGIINPKLNDFITHEEADEFFDDLALIAVDLPLKHCLSLKKKELQKEKNEEGYKWNEEERQKYEQAIEYLTKCQQDKEEKIEELT